MSRQDASVVRILLMILLGLLGGGRSRRRGRR